MMHPQKTVFLDRDGVINERVLDGYVSCLNDFHLIEGAVQAMSALSKEGYRLVVITNQRGLHLGLYTVGELKEIHTFLSGKVGLHGGVMNEFYFCPHDRDEGCSCRKPSPGMIDQAVRQQPVLWEESWLVGDTDSDLLAGKARGLRVIKIGVIEEVKPDYTFPDLGKAADFIIKEQKRK